MQEFVAVGLRDDVNISTIRLSWELSTQSGKAKASSQSNATSFSLSRQFVATFSWKRMKGPLCMAER
jgi:hypothetical protein